MTWQTTGSISKSLALGLCVIVAGGLDSSSAAAFLSKQHGEAAQPSESTPKQDDTNFDGRWVFTSSGCPHTGSLPAIIRRGKIIIRGGSGFVSPDGTLHSVGAGGGMTLTAVGQMTTDTGAGTFDRSDGCVGSWIAIKR